MRLNAPAPFYLPTPLRDISCTAHAATNCHNRPRLLPLPLSDMRLQLFASELHSLADCIARNENPDLRAANSTFFSPHTRIERTRTSAQDLRKSESVLQSLEEILAKTRRLYDSVRLEHAQLANSLCPALQLPEDILRLIFLLCDSSTRRVALILFNVCQKWRSNVSAFPSLWTTIDTSDSLPILRRSLKLSRELPIHLQFLRPPPHRVQQYTGDDNSTDVTWSLGCRSIERLTIKYNAWETGTTLRNAVGRGSKLWRLFVESIHVSGRDIWNKKDSLDIRLDMRGVDFQGCPTLHLRSCAFPILGMAQITGPKLRVWGLDTTTRDLEDFFKSFEYIEGLEIGGKISDNSNSEDPWDLVELPPIYSLAISDSTVDDVVRLLDLMNTENCEILDLDSILELPDNSPDPRSLADYAEVIDEHFDDEDHYPRVTCLRITEDHDQLPMVLDNVLGLQGTNRFPELQELHIITGDLVEPESKIINPLELSLIAILSNRVAQDLEPIALYVPSCLRNIENELAPLTSSVTFEECCDGD
ncbi:hypothetical protein DL93DRAFT_454581 [Clavulina sp. PMI_390]|nr:hypothetical protein DL93DRAFT_454581 [Clavulina sp. PMI_390]